MNPMPVSPIARCILASGLIALAGCGDGEDTALTDAEVEAIIADDGYAPAAELADGDPGTTPVSWDDLTGTPEVVTPLDLDDGDPSTVPVSWDDLVDVPAGVTDPGASAMGTVGNLARFTNPSELGDSVLLEDGQGHIGLGMAPNHTLTINGDAGATFNRTIQMVNRDLTDGNNLVIDFWGATSTSGQTSFALIEGRFESHENSLGELHFYTRNGNTIDTRMTILSNGFVGIGTEEPGQELHVVGNILVDGGNYLSVSDERLKAHITPLEGGLDKVSALRGVRYDLVGEAPTGEPGRHVGFLAREVEAVVPEVVATNDEGYKGVDYGRLTAVLVEAIHDQQAIIDAQAAQLDSLEARLAALEQARN